MPARSQSAALIAFDEAGLGERPGRAVAAGRARQISRGVYTTDVTTPLERVVRTHVWQILAHLMPDALIADRSAGPALFDGDTLFVISASRTRNVELPGLRVAVRRGHPPFPDDPPWMAALRKSSIPRALVENLARSRTSGGVRRTLSGDEVAAWVAQLAQQYPPDRLNRLRDRARELADELQLTDRFTLLDKWFAIAQGTARAPRADLLAAMGAGHGWDVARLARFSQLAERLGSGEIDPDPAALPIQVPAMLAEQPFFEAYLSNFIEGTEFSLDEAIGIVYDQQLPPARPADAHDVTSTYELIVDPIDAAAAPTSGAQLLDQLERRHSRLMAARPDKRPGQFKKQANRVGSYEFVAPELARATLERGLSLAAPLLQPFARAVYMMFLVSEVHPFDDGNGRLARLAMNTELTAVGQHRILIPLITRDDYLAGLRRLSREGDPRLLVRVLTNAWRWSSQVDFSSLEIARVWMERTNALTDSADAERSGQYLVLPSDLAP